MRLLFSGSRGEFINEGCEMLPPDAHFDRVQGAFFRKIHFSYEGSLFVQEEGEAICTERAFQNGICSIPYVLLFQKAFKVAQ